MRGGADFCVTSWRRRSDCMRSGSALGWSSCTGSGGAQGCSSCTHSRHVGIKRLHVLGRRFGVGRSSVAPGVEFAVGVLWYWPWQ